MPSDPNPALALLRRQADDAEDDMSESRHKASLAREEATKLDRDAAHKRAEAGMWDKSAEEHRARFEELRLAIEALTGEPHC